MTYTFDQLKEDVRKEAEALRVHATSEELGRLDFEKLRPDNVTMCIYGQMTGNCDSPRATELITTCTRTYIESTSSLNDMELNKTFADFRWSPIEFYILQRGSKNANLIAYLKGETETLEL
jgi:hypothetical protein